MHFVFLCVCSCPVRNISSDSDCYRLPGKKWMQDMLKWCMHAWKKKGSDHGCTHTLLLILIFLFFFLYLFPSLVIDYFLWLLISSLYILFHLSFFIQFRHHSFDLFFLSSSSLLLLLLLLFSWFFFHFHHLIFFFIYLFIAIFFSFLM